MPGPSDWRGFSNEAASALASRVRTDRALLAAPPPPTKMGAGRLLARNVPPTPARTFQALQPLVSKASKGKLKVSLCGRGALQPPNAARPRDLFRLNPRGALWDSCSFTGMSGWILLPARCLDKRLYRVMFPFVLLLLLPGQADFPDFLATVSLTGLEGIIAVIYLLPPSFPGLMPPPSVTGNFKTLGLCMNLMVGSAIR